MSGQRAVVGKNNFVTDRAVVPDVTICEKISTITNLRFSFTRRAAIDRHKLAERIFMPDFKISWLATIFQVLRLLPDRAIGVELVLPARAHWAAQSNVMLQPAVLSS